MSYKVIEKNEYGIRVRNYSGIPDCHLCKNVVEKSTCKRSECAPNSYYLPDSEVERLELENDLKAKNEALIKFLEDNIECCKIHEIQKNSTDPVDIATVAMYITYKNVLEFIKNQKGGECDLGRHRSGEFPQWPLVGTPPPG